MIIIESKRKKAATILKKYPNAILVDVIVAIGLVVLFLVERENDNDNANGE